MVLVLEGEMQDRLTYFNRFKDHWRIFVISTQCTCWSYCEMIYTWGFWLWAMHAYEAAPIMDVTPLSVYIWIRDQDIWLLKGVWCAYFAQVQADPASKFGWPQCLNLTPNWLHSGGQCTCACPISHDIMQWESSTHVLSVWNCVLLGKEFSS